MRQLSLNLEPTVSRVERDLNLIHFFVNVGESRLPLPPSHWVWTSLPKIFLDLNQSSRPSTSVLVPRPPTFIETEEPGTGIAQPLALSKNKTGTDVNYLEPNEFYYRSNNCRFLLNDLVPKYIRSYCIFRQSESKWPISYEFSFLTKLRFFSESFTL